MGKRKIIETDLEPALEDIKSIESESKKRTKSKSKVAKDSKPTIETSKKSTSKSEGPKKRYIVFVGNLPFTTSKEELEGVFEDSSPNSIRLLTDKVTKKPRGIAFVEFSSSSNLELALAKHHTDFKGRRINVELTVGGGGNKSEDRKTKIKTKNEMLAEERKMAQAQKASKF